MSTIQTIAEKAGVAKSTVSRYLNGGSVSSATAAKLEKIIKEENYSPSPFARSLKAKSSPIIGVVIPRLDSAATAHTLQGIEEVAQSMGYQLLIANSNMNPKQEIHALHQFQKNKVAGIIFLATRVTKHHIQHLERLDIPFVLVGQPYEGMHCVLHDDYQAGKALANEMIALGHKKILYVGVTDEDYSVGLIRKNGVMDTLKAANIEEVAFVRGSFSSKESVEIGEKIFENIQHTAVIAATDMMAVGLLKAAHNKGIRVPEDVSIAGFGGYEIGHYVHPSLSTVRYQFTKAGKTAMDVLLNLIKGQTCGLVTIIPTTVDLRESTDYYQSNK